VSYDEAGVRWLPAWIALWVWNVIALAVLAPMLKPGAWLAAFFVLFLLPEMIGLRRHRDALPPLTYVVRRYVPRWVPTAATFAAGAWLAVLWLPMAAHPALVAVGDAAMVGWLTNHWDVTYDVA